MKHILPVAVNILQRFLGDFPIVYLATIKYLTGYTMGIIIDNLQILSHIFSNINPTRHGYAWQ